MKSVKLILLVFAMSFFGNSLFAQESAEVYAVITKAKWCPTCVKNGPRVEKDVLPNVDMSKVLVIVNDLSDDNTKETSMKSLKMHGLDQLKLKSTGVISFVDVKTKKVISSVKVGKSTEAIIEAFKNSHNKM